MKEKVTGFVREVIYATVLAKAVSVTSRVIRGFRTGWKEGKTKKK